MTGRLVVLSEWPARGEHDRSNVRLAKFAGMGATLETMPGEHLYLFPTWQAARPSLPERLARARGMLPRLEGCAVLLAGVNVAQSFGVTAEPYFEWRLARMFDVSEIVFSVIPHPSPLNRVWNNVSTRRQGQRFLAELFRAAKKDEAAVVKAVHVAAHTRPLHKDTNVAHERLMGYHEAAGFLSITYQGLRVLVARKKIPHVRISERTVRFSPSELRAWLATKRVGVV